MILLPLVAESSLATAFTFVAEHDALIGIAATWLIAAYLYLRVRSDWRDKKFTEQVNFSLNDVRDNKLVLRTMVERSAKDILVSPIAVKQFKSGIASATEAQPFFSLPKDDDWGYCMRACLNDLSEMCAPVYVAQALRQAVSTARFVFGISFECYGEINTRKIRVIVVAEDLLKEYFLPDSDPAKVNALVYEDPKHKDRTRTLQALGRLYASTAPADKRKIAIVELGVTRA